MNANFGETEYIEGQMLEISLFALMELHKRNHPGFPQQIRKGNNGNKKK